MEKSKKVSGRGWNVLCSGASLATALSHAWDKPACHCTATTSKQKGKWFYSKCISHLTSNSQTSSHGLSSYATSRILDTLWTPSESRKCSDPLQAKLSCKRSHLCAPSLITLVIKQQKEGRADLLNLLHQWPLPSKEGCSGSEIAAGKAHTLLFIQPLQLWASRTSPDKRAQHYL